MTERLPFHFSLSCIGEGNGSLLHYSFLGNPVDRGAWWAIVHRVARVRYNLASKQQQMFSLEGKKNFNGG